MKVFAISDLHLSINNPKPMDIFGPAWDDYLNSVTDSWQENVGENDVVLIAGDISWAMTLQQAKADIDFLGALNGKKVIIRGNHDYWWKSISLVRSALPCGMFAVQNDCLRIGDFLFCGSRGWTVDGDTDEDKKLFNRELIRMELSLESMSKLRRDGDNVVAMVHYPPFNFKIEKNKMTDLFARFNVDKVVYGHLHGKGVRVLPTANIDGVEYVLTSCDLVKNKVVRIL